MADFGDFRDDVKQKLVNLKYFEKNPVDLARVFFYLDEADREYTAAEFSPFWKNFKYLLKNDKAFEALAKRYAEDTKRAEMDPEFLRVMTDMYEHLMTPTDSEVPMETCQGFDLKLVADEKKAHAFGWGGFARAWSLIPAETRASFLTALPNIINNRSVMLSVDEAVGLVSKHGGKVVQYGLAAVYLSYQALKNIWRWYKGEISGRRCAKNVIDASVATAAGIGGGIGGAALGSLVMPGIGTLAGGIIGGIAASGAAQLLCDRLTQWLFDLPKEEAVENAYRYLGVKPSASNADVNIAFRKLCLKHHPDKGGDREEFFVLQNNMAVIRLARGEM